MPNSSSVIAFADAGGLGLPDRDYYTKTDAKSEEIRQKYLAHMAQMFQLLGDSPEAAAADAKAVMRIETALAKASLTRVEKRDPYKLFHKMTRAELQALTPSFRLERISRRAAGARPSARSDQRHRTRLLPRAGSAVEDQLSR